MAPISQRSQGRGGDPRGPVAFQKRPFMRILKSATVCERLPETEQFNSFHILKITTLSSKKTIRLCLKQWRSNQLCVAKIPFWEMGNRAVCGLKDYELHCAIFCCFTFVALLDFVSHFRNAFTLDFPVDINAIRVQFRLGWYILVAIVGASGNLLASRVQRQKDGTQQESCSTSAHYRRRSCAE